MNIKIDDLTDPDVKALVSVHQAELAANENSLTEHALDLDNLRDDDVTFLSVWEGETLTGCGAIKELADSHGEIKSMHTARPFRRRGVSAALLFHMIRMAQERGYKRLSLETHPGADYKPARKLYERFGFEPCGPFAGYKAHDHSVFMTKEV